MTLTQEEREKFAAYLDAEVVSAAAILEQLEKIKAPEMMIKITKSEIAASRFIAKRLRQVENQTINVPEALHAQN